MNPVSPKPSRSGSSSSLNEDLNENTVLESEPHKENNEFLVENIKVKVCDFSFSQIMIPGKPILGMMGTVAYSGKIIGQ